MAPEAVNVLILGGLTHLARPLLRHLVTLDGTPRVKLIRMVDKFLIAGKASSTYVDPDTEEALQDARVEYRQANLNIAGACVPASVPACSPVLTGIDSDGVCFI